MNIAVVNSSRELFGADRSAVDLAELFANLGHDVRLVIPQNRRETGLAAFAASRGVRWVEANVAVATSRGIVGAFGLVARSQLSADLVVLNTTAVMRAAINSQRRVLVIREWLEPGRVTHRMLVRLHERSVDYVVGVSHGVVGQWHQLASTGVPAAVIQNWIHEDWLSGSSLGAQVPRGILCVGRFNSWKGQEALADAYELAFQDGSRPQLTFLGAEESPSPFHEKAARIEARGAGKWNVLPVTENSKGAMRQANLLVVPSLHPEPFGLVIVEALAAGCKVIAFEGGGPTDLAKDFPTSLEVVPRSISALAEALRRWWDTGGDRQQPREHQETLATLHKRYSRETAGAKWSAVIASMTVG